MTDNEEYLAQCSDGPWSIKCVEVEPGIIRYFIHGVDDQIVGMVSRLGDAHTIAAAPGMLSALEIYLEAESALDDNHELAAELLFDHALEMTTEAVAAAYGEEVADIDVDLEAAIDRITDLEGENLILRNKIAAIDAGLRLVA